MGGAVCDGSKRSKRIVANSVINSRHIWQHHLRIGVRACESADAVTRHQSVHKLLMRDKHSSTTSALTNYKPMGPLSAYTPRAYVKHKFGIVSWDAAIAITSVLRTMLSRNAIRLYCCAIVRFVLHSDRMCVRVNSLRVKG